MSYTSVLLLLVISLVLVYSAAGLECRIYVSSSDGINNTSCWTGGVQTPCATIDLAIQGTTATDVRDNCSSITIVYLYPPGNDTIELQAVRNSVSMVGNMTLPVSIPDNNALSLNDCPSMSIIPINERISCPTFDLDSDCNCDKFMFYVSITDCNGAVFPWVYDLHVCVSDSISQGINCSYISSDIEYCDSDYELPSCYEHITGDPIELTLNISTLGPLQINTVSKVNVTLFDNVCHEALISFYINGSCEVINIPVCKSQEYCPICYYFEYWYYNDYYSYSYYEGYLGYGDYSYDGNYWYYQGNRYYGEPNPFGDICYDNSSLNSFNFTFCTICPSGYGVSINKITECVQCEDYLMNILIFIGIEIIPMTLMVLIIMMFNIQLTNGSINGLVFYSQVMFFIFSDLTLLTPNNQLLILYAIPSNIFSLDFTPFLGNYSLCIAPNMSPLGAISFWYVIGFYPLLLLLLLYVWITLYDKGYKCVVFITRPFHRCMARFWSMTGIEPSFTHSIASIYILCFTQLAGTSFKLLRFNYNYYTNNENIYFFFYDSCVQYFHGIHAVAGSFAISVLLIMILLPTLYILLYPFKWFHKLLDCLHLRKQLLISVADVFTGPYKNGTENTYDYRFFAGLYLIAKIIVLCSQILLNFYFDPYFIIPKSVQGCIVFLLAIMILVFRPFKRNIHSITEVIILIFLMGYFIFLIVEIFVNGEYYDTVIAGIIISTLNGLLFGILSIYIMYQIIKTILNCINYYKQHNRTVPANTEEQEENQPLVVDDWIADRMENPLKYNEQHVQVPIEDYLPPNIEQPNNNNNDTNYIPTAATYGSINNPTMQQ